MGVGSDALRRGLLRRATRSRRTRRNRPKPRDRPLRAGPGATRSGCILAVAAVVLVGVGLRFFARSDLWADEVLSVNISGLPLSQLHERAEARRRAPALLPPPACLDAGVRHRQRDRACALRASSASPRWSRVVRRPPARPAPRLAAGCGRRLAHVAWARCCCSQLSPFAIRYSTETRMYSLVMLWSSLGYLALARVFDRPSWGPARCASRILTGLLLYTHYWSFSLLAVVGLWVAVPRGPRVAPSGAAGALLGRRAFAVGAHVRAVAADVPLPGASTPARRGARW